MEESTATIVEGALMLIGVFFTPALAIIPAVQKIFEGLTKKENKEDAE
jgi:hypothetical protein